MPRGGRGASRIVPSGTHAGFQRELPLRARRPAVGGCPVSLNGQRALATGLPSRGFAHDGCAPREAPGNALRRTGDGTPGRFKTGLAIGGRMPHDSQADGRSWRNAALRARGVGRLRISAEERDGSSGLFHPDRAWIARVGGVPLAGVRFFDSGILFFDPRVTWLDPRVAFVDPRVLFIASVTPSPIWGTEAIRIVPGNGEVGAGGYAAVPGHGLIRSRSAARASCATSVPCATWTRLWHVT